ncbi:MAG: phosphate ABC transporter permease PstA [Desulfomonilaceae bacterium]
MNDENLHSHVDNIQRRRNRDFKSRGEPFLWILGGSLVIGLMMIVGFVALILYNGLLTFFPNRIQVVELANGSRVAGELVRCETYRPEPDMVRNLPEAAKKELKANDGFLKRCLYKTGNFDLYNEDYKWVASYDIRNISQPTDIVYVERMEWGPFIGKIDSIDLNGVVVDKNKLSWQKLRKVHQEAENRRQRIQKIEKGRLLAVNHYLESNRLYLKKVELRDGLDSPAYKLAEKKFKTQEAKLDREYKELSGEADALRQVDSKYTITMSDVENKKKEMKLSDIVRFYQANKLSSWDRIQIYFSRWLEFLTQEPREANTEGGVLPAIFGTFCMTVLMALIVAPFGVVAALYLREYAKQGRLVSIIRICVNNLAGVPSIVYGVFGLGFFAYVLGGSIDQIFFPERFPNPTFGTGGLLWASLTLALLTVPVVIVATEEALAAVPQSMREGSLACGASKWQTIRRIVLPRAMPGIMTGLILAMARGAGEVAPLMLVGVVKMAPELPIDQFPPYIHLERSFMHLGFHIFDLAFQSRNSEAAIPMVYVTTLLLITLVFSMNIVSIIVRNRLKRKFFTGHF